MTAAEAVGARVTRITSNRGHMRILAVAYVVWIVVTAVLAWQPLPEAPRAVDFFGADRVVACDSAVLDYDECAAKADQNAGAIAVTLRIAVVIFGPWLLGLGVVAGLFVIEWVREGYRQKES